MNDDDPRRRIRSRGRVVVRPEHVDERGFIEPAARTRLRLDISSAQIGRDLELDLGPLRYVDALLVDDLADAVRRGCWLTVAGDLSSVDAWERSVRRAVSPLAVVS